MKLIAPIIVAFLTLVNAQSRSDIPDCAQSCIDGSVEKVTSCATDDFTCICNNMDVIKEDTTACVLKACGQDVALNKALPAIKELCIKVENSGSQSSIVPASSIGTSTGQPASTVQPTETAQAISTTGTAGAASFTAIGGPAILALGALFL